MTYVAKTDEELLPHELDAVITIRKTKELLLGLEASIECLKDLNEDDEYQMYLRNAIWRITSLEFDLQCSEERFTIPELRRV